MRAGRVFDVELDVTDAAEAERLGREAADRVLANGLIEGYEVVGRGAATEGRSRRVSAPRIGVITFPGSCDDRDALRAVELARRRGGALWHADADLDGCRGVIVPGGFSYGDYLRAGRSPASRR